MYQITIISKPALINMYRFASQNNGAMNTFQP